jgi:hypothetical protein
MREVKHEIVPVLFNLTISSAILIVIINDVIVTTLFIWNSIGNILYETSKRCETVNSTSTIRSDFPSATLIVIMYEVIVPILFIVNIISTILNSSRVLPT